MSSAITKTQAIMKKIFPMIVIILPAVAYEFFLGTPFDLMNDSQGLEGLK
jgi:hypothetical protein